jgi:hypothetical protein
MTSEIERAFHRRRGGLPCGLICWRLGQGGHESVLIGGYQGPGHEDRVSTDPSALKSLQMVRFLNRGARI